MKRLLIFAVLGPPLGLLTGMWGIIPVLNWSLGAPTVFDYHQISLIPLAYMVGLVPALLRGVFDGILARRNIGYRVLWCALFGYAMSFIPLLSSLSKGFPARAVRADIRLARRGAGGGVLVDCGGQQRAGGITRSWIPRLSKVQRRANRRSDTRSRSFHCAPRPRRHEPHSDRRSLYRHAPALERDRYRGPSCRPRLRDALSTATSGSPELR